MSQVDGIYANHALLTIINDLVGKEVLVEAIDGAKYSGIFTACSPEFDIGLRHAYKITTGNITNLLPKKEDMTTKMLFKFSDIVAMSALMNEEKVIRGFATDRDYHVKQQNGRLGDEEHELQEWSADEDGEEFEQLDQMPDQRQRYQRNNGWNVEEMFSTNSQMGVQSTYEEDLRQYTTAPVEGNEEDRRRADQIAREIESSQQSKFNARLENDDDERDLDKQTTEDDFEIQSKRSVTGQRGNFSSRSQRNGVGGPSVGNRRVDVPKGGTDRRSSGASGRYPGQAHGVNSSQNRVISGNKYESKTRPTAQELTDSFSEFSLNKEGNPRRDSSQGQKTYENKGQNQSTKILLEPRSSASSRNTSSETKSQSGAAARRADGLRGWNQEFNNNYRPEGKADTPRESPARATPAAPTGNAWARGPPTSVTNMHNSQHTTPTPTSPPRAVETNAADPASCSTNDQPPDASSTTASSPQTESSPTVAPAPTPTPAPNSGTRAASHETTPDSTATASGTTEKEEGTKKFTFNVNAPAFKPRSATSQIQQSQQVAPPPSGPPQAMMGAVPMVPAGVPIQTAMPPPGILPTMQTGQPPVLVQWQGAPAQQYQIPGYQYVVAGGQPVSMMASQPMAMGGPRHSGPPAVAFQQGSRRQVMVPPSAQWQPHVMQVGQGMVPYTYQSFSVQGGGSGGASAGVVPAPPPQSGFSGPQAPPPQMMPSTPQAAAPPPGIYPQRFVPAQGYVLPQAGVQGQARFPTPQQTPHQGMEAAHFQAQGASGSAATSTGPNSQPPTPGPSPAQGGRGGSPVQQATVMQQSVGPPPPQQFMAPVSATPPHFYATAQPVYGMYSAPTGQGMVVYGGPGGVPMAMPPTHHDPTMMQQSHQQQQQQQQGSGGIPPPHHQQYAIPHEGYGNFVQATPFYQQPPPNQMSRQNSCPQGVYPQQGPGAPQPPQQQQQQASQNTSSTAPSQQQ